MKAAGNVARKLTLAALLAFSGGAFAQPYVGLGFSAARGDLSGSSGNGSASEVTAGYRVSAHLAGEVSYFDTDGRTEPTQQGTTSTLRFWKSRGAGIFAVGILPVGMFSLVGKAGGYKLETSLRELVTGPGGTLSDTTVEASDWRRAFGLGAQFTIAEHVRVRAMLERVEGKGEQDSLRLFTVGAVVSF